MTITYRTSGAWGPGKGSNLQPVEVDSNFYDLASRLDYIDANPVLPIEPISITISGYAFSMGLSNGETLGPIAMTMPVPTWRGTWSPATTYAAMDYITAPDGGFGAVMQGHVSAAVFDWAALGANGLPLYREIVGGSGTTARLGDLTDVALTGIATGDLLVYDTASAYWHNETPVEFAAHFATFGGDTGSGGTQGMVPAPDAGDAAAGKVLGAGGEWVTVAAEGGGSSSLSGLTDTAISAPATGHLLRYSSTDGKWHNVTLAALGAGTVSLIDTPAGGGLTGGPITASGSLTLAAIASGTLLGNAQSGTAIPQGVTVSELLDRAFGSVRGSLLSRGASGWTELSPGTTGLYLQSAGTGANLLWSSPAGAGTVQSVGSGAGLTGGPITATGTLALAAIGDGLLLGNVSGGATAPTATPLTLLLDRYSTTRGAVLFRGASTWTALAPGAAGDVLTSGGALANPVWAAATGGGASVTVSGVMPLDPTPGDLWWDSSDGSGQLFVFFNDGTSSQWVIANSTPLVEPPPTKYAIGFSFVGGVLAASQLLGLHRLSAAVTIPANFGAVAGHISQAGATAAATSSTVVSVDRALSASPNSFSPIGSITVAAGSVAATFATTAGAPVAVAQGDVVRLVGPATADATLANLYATLVAQEA